MIAKTVAAAQAMGEGLAPPAADDGSFVWGNLEMAAKLFPGSNPKCTGYRMLAGVRPGDERLRWYVVRSATRQEKRAEESLMEAGLPVYLPRFTRWRRHAGRKHRVHLPLLPGYLFVGVRNEAPGDQAHDLQLILAAEWVHDLVRFSKDRMPVAAPFKDIRRFLEQEQAGEFDRTGKTREDPAKDDPVQITGGKFQGFPAKFVKRRPNERIELLVQMFGRWSTLTERPENVEGCSDEDS